MTFAVSSADAADRVTLDEEGNIVELRSIEVKYPHISYLSRCTKILAVRR
jgi:hypothetical protein